MAAFNIHLYKDTLDLLELYNRNLSFKTSFQRLLERGGVTYRGRPLKTYVKLLSFIDIQYNKYLQEKLDVASVDELFDHFYNRNPASFQRLEESIKTQTPLMPLEVEEEIARIEEMPDGREKQQKWQEHEKQEEPRPSPPQLPRQVVEEIEQIEQAEGKPRITIRPQVPEAVKTAGSQAQIGAKNLGTKALSGLGDMVGDTASLLRGGGLLGRAGGLAAQGAARLGVAAVGLSGGALLTAGGIVLVAILIALFVGIVMPMFFQEQRDEALLMTPIAAAAPITSVENISQCKFTRSDQNPKEINYKSSLLLQYFQEASGKTDIPAVVIAAFMRVESPGITNYTNEQVQGYQCIREGPGKNVSPTGALGVMQIQPQGTKGHDGPAVANGAKLIGITYNDLTEADYCDVRKSIIMGAGFILKKMSYKGFGDGTKWDPSWTNNKAAIDALVTGYYGCLPYGGKKDCTGPYNYGSDVFTSIQACKPPTPSTPTYNPGGGTGIVSCPVNGGYVYHGSKATGGHCDPNNYKFQCTPPGQPGYTGRETAVDVQGPEKTVYFPNLGGNPVEWTIVEDPTKGGDIKDSEGGGKAITAQSSYNGHTYSVRFVHLEPSSVTVSVGQKANSGKDVGKYNGNANHVHITIQEDGQYKPADLYFNLCK